MGRGLGRKSRVSVDHSATTPLARPAPTPAPAMTGGGIREPLELSDGITTLLWKMSEGNPGATSVLMQIIEKDQMSGLMVILGLDDMNMRGSQIWTAYKEHCGEKIDDLLARIKTRDPEMVKTVNELCPRAGEMAVQYAGSDRSKRQLPSF